MSPEQKPEPNCDTPEQSGTGCLCSSHSKDCSLILTQILNIWLMHYSFCDTIGLTYLIYCQTLCFVALYVNNTGFLYTSILCTTKLLHVYFSFKLSLTDHDFCYILVGFLWYLFMTNLLKDESKLFQRWTLLCFYYCSQYSTLQSSLWTTPTSLLYYAY